MTEIGNCSKNSDKCLAGTFCPTDSQVEVLCENCSSKIPFGKGCNCVDNTTIQNCVSCEFGKCNKCHKGLILNQEGTQCSESQIQLFRADQPCTTSQDCDEANFCNPQGICQKCGGSCKICLTERICSVCYKKVPNVFGVCENTCNPGPKNGQFCTNGTVRTCRDGQTQPCICGSAKNCANCNTEFSGCQECLNGFKMVNGECNGECDEGFYKYGNLCFISVGQCNSARDGCLTDTFCPAADITMVDCQPCGDSIKGEQGCNCIGNNKIIYCQTCSSGKCSKCIKGFGLKSDSNACGACSENCSDCSQAASCDTCLPGFFLDPAKKMCQACSQPNCMECTDTVTCTVCQDKFSLQDKVCILPCTDSSDCTIDATFCNLTTKICQACGENCTTCQTEEICGSCVSGKQLTINGECENSCSPAPSSGQYCKNGTVIACDEDLTAQCICGTKLNCGSCTSDRSQCEICLPGFMLNAGACSQCAEGYTTYSTLCLLDYVEPGKCTSATDSCLVDTFCPAADITMVDCQPCGDSIKGEQGCNCIGNNKIIYCQTCSSGKCSKCIKGFGLKSDSNACGACSENCSDCSQAASCDTCLPGFFLDPAKKMCQACSQPNCMECTDTVTCTVCQDKFSLQDKVCILPCTDSSDCTIDATFCNLTTKICQACGENCTTCQTEEICGSCVSGKQLTINGECENSCSPAPSSGQYCKNGTVIACDEDLTAQCICGTKLNCGSCTSDRSQCEICLPGFMLNAGACSQCAEGYTTYSTLCLLDYVEPGKCTSATDSCLVDTFCPAADITMVDCQPCGDSIKGEQGCNCIGNNKIIYCQTCSSGKCSKCIKGFGLKSDSNACGACSENCSDCSQAASCDTCLPGFFLDPAKKMCQACSQPNCMECTDTVTCTVCQDKFSLQDKVCILPCTDSSDCTIDATFCNLTTKICQACGENCTTCQTEEICGSCVSGKQLTINGECENSCSPAPSSGQYCKNGTVIACDEDLTAQCICGTKLNCGSCTSDRSQCEICLPGFMLNAGACSQCAEGYTTYSTLCLLDYVEPGKCTSATDSCLVDTFCPAADITMVDCQPCGDSIKGEQGCNCIGNNKIIYCQTCSSGKCSKCIKGFGLKSDSNACGACSENCSDCSQAASCDTCLPGFFLDPAKKMCQACSQPNCMECTDTVTCTVCQDKFSLQDKVCILPCTDSSDCTIDATFCNLTTKICQACGENCTTCQTEEICGSCVSGKQLTINGECENSCSPAPSSGQYCKNGTVIACDEDLTAQCICGTKLNCGSCTSDRSQCEICLPGFMLNAGACSQCAEGYTTYSTLCLLDYVEPGKCTSATDSCLVDTFCPAADITMVDCQPCGDSIKGEQGCNCIGNNKIIYCQTCSSGKCSKCIKGFGLKSDSNACGACSENCSDCSQAASCDTCLPGFFLDPAKKMCQACSQPNCMECTDTVTCTVCQDKFSLQDKVCILPCTDSSDCTIDATFCNLTTKICQACGENCTTCQTEEICGSCVSGKQLTINGECENSCSPAPSSGQYCKNGTALDCEDGLTFECICSTSKNCASCTRDKIGCDKCLPGFKKDGKNCIQCDKGYDKYNNLCLKNNIVDATKLQGGAIAGIVIACLAVCAVGIGLTYYFVKKTKVKKVLKVQPTVQKRQDE